MKNRKSFTLMELLVVITIIAVLAAVSIPQVIGVIQRAQDTAIRMNMRVMLTEATRISILEGDLSRIHCNTGGHPDILAICETVRAHSPHPAQLRSSATARAFWIRAPLHDGTFWRVDHTGFAGRDLGDYIARWDMDEGSDQVVGDTTGTNPGTRGPTTAVEAQDPTWAVGYLTFDGANDFINRSGTTSLDNITDAVTVEAWINTRAFGVNQYRGMVSKRSPHVIDGCQVGYGLVSSWGHGHEGRDVWFAVHTEATLSDCGNWVEANMTLSLDRWYHIVGTYDSTTGRQQIYVDGFLRNTRNWAIGTRIRVSTGTPLKIGRNYLAHWVFNGFIDNVRIYNRALTAEEVRISFLRGR